MLLKPSPTGFITVPAGLMNAAQTFTYWIYKIVYTGELHTGHAWVLY